jgi:hypothetical protein
VTSRRATSALITLLGSILVMLGIIADKLK